MGGNKFSSSVDLQYVNLLDEVLIEGFEYNDPNRKGVKRLQIPHATVKFDLSDGTFPAINLRKVSPKVAFAEFSAFFQNKYTLHELEEMGCKFWRKDAFRFHKKTKGYPHSFEKFEEELPDVDMGMIYPKQMYEFGGINGPWEDSGYDQVNSVLDEILEHPFGTKRTVTMWNPNDAEKMALTPCHWSFELVTYKSPDGESKLDLVWHQHSVDLFLGLPYNFMYYGYALHYFAMFLGFTPGNLVGHLTNVHLYDNQWDAAAEVKLRYFEGEVSDKRSPALEWMEFPRVVESFEDFVLKSKVKVVNYHPLPAVTGIEMLTYTE